MAKVEVGMQLSWQGRPVICTSIQTTNETLYARKDSLTMRTEMSGLANVKVLAQQWDDFDEGDIVSISLQRLELTEPGKNIYFIYSYYNVKKEGLHSNGSERSEASNREASHSASAASGLGDQGGESAGQQSVGEDGGPTDGSGSSGAGGQDHSPKVGKEGEYPVAHYGSSATCRA